MITDSLSAPNSPADEFNFIFKTDHSSPSRRIADRRLNTPPPLDENESFNDGKEDTVPTEPSGSNEEGVSIKKKYNKRRNILVKPRPQRVRKQNCIPNVLADSELEEYLGSNRRASVKKRKNQLPTTSQYRNSLSSTVQYNPFRNWCAVCGVVYELDNNEEKDCPTHKITHIPDSQIPSKARLSLPSCLKLCSTSPADQGDHNGETAVFAKTLIKQQTRFGPYIAPLSQDAPQIFPLRLDCLNVVNDSTCDYNTSWYLSPGNEDVCNWLMFVKPAQNVLEQNLIVYQSEFCLYYESVRTIKPNEQLRVWYSPYYALTLKTKMLPSLEDYSIHENLNGDDNLQTSAATHPGDVNLGLDSKCKHRVKSKKTSLLHVFSEELSGFVSRDEIHCSLCRLTFASDNTLQIHKLTHPGEVSSRGLTQESLNRASECPICMIEFLDLLSLAEHVVEHSIVQPKHFPSTLQSNIQTVVQKVLYACGQCGSKFDHLYELREHKTENQHFRPAVVESSTTVQHNNHSIKESDTVEDGLNSQSQSSPCPYCSMVFKSQKGLKTHVKSHNNDFFYKCVVCDLSLSSSDKLKSHIKQHMVMSDTGGTQYACHKCNKTYPSYAKLATHTRQVHSKRILLCPYCPKSFCRPFKLEEHVRTHTGDRPFSCSFCFKGFSRKDKLNSHIKAKHTEALRSQDNRQNSKRIMDIISTTRYQSKSLLQPKHLNLFHYDKEVHSTANHSTVLYTYSEAQNIFSCRQCRFKCRRRGMLLNHMLKFHPQISNNKIEDLKQPAPVRRQFKNYYCNYCSMKFRSNNMRRSHILRAHPSQSTDELYEHNLDLYLSPNAPFECNLCCRQFKSQHMFKSHLRMKHPDTNVLSQENSETIVSYDQIDNEMSDMLPTHDAVSNHDLILCDPQQNLSQPMIQFDPSSLLYSTTALESEKSNACDSQQSLDAQQLLASVSSISPQHVAVSLIKNFNSESSDWPVNYEVFNLSNWQNMSNGNETLLPHSSLVPQIVELTHHNQNDDLSSQYHCEDSQQYVMDG